MAKKRGSMVEIKCHLGDSGNVSWLRKQETDSEAKLFLPEKGRILQTHNSTEATLIIQDIQFPDNGIYFCKQECSQSPPRTERGCGTELRVMGACGARPPAREESGCARGAVHTHPTPARTSRGATAWRRLWPSSTWESR